MKHYALALLLTTLAVPLHAQQTQTLHEAAKKGDADAARALIAAGEDVKAGNKNGQTPLHLAAGHGHVELIRMLTEAGADVNAKDNAGSTPLHTAAKAGYAPAKRLARTLLRNTTVSGTVKFKDRSKDGGGDAEATQEINWSGADASALGEAGAVRTLIGAGADVNASNEDGVTPLHAAALNDDVEVAADAVRALTEGGANVKAREKAGFTPLHVAAHGGRAETVRALMASGADVDAVSEEGFTPLLLATNQGHRGAALALQGISAVEAEKRRLDAVEEAKRRLLDKEAAARCSAHTAPAGLAVAGGVLAPAFDRDQTSYDVWAHADHLDITASATAEVIELRGTSPDGSPLRVAGECAVMGMAAGRNSITVEVEWEDGARGTYALAAHYAGESVPVEAGDLILPSEDCFLEDGDFDTEACYATHNGVGGVLAREVTVDRKMRIDESGLVKSASGHHFAAHPELREKGLLGSGTAAEQGKFPVWKDYRFLSGVGPKYPRRAQVRGITGKVGAEFCVTASGETSGIKIVDGRPPGIFDRALYAAVQQFRYEPRMVLGRPVQVCGLRISFNFDID